MRNQKQAPNRRDINRLNSERRTTGNNNELFVDNEEQQLTTMKQFIGDKPKL